MSSAWSRPRTSNEARTPVSRTWSARPSRTCCTSSRLAPGGGDDVEQVGEPARPVVDPHEHGEPPTGLGLVATDEPGHHAEVDVAARQHDARRALARHVDEVAHQRGHADGAGALDVQLGALHEVHHRVGDRVLVDRHDVVDPLLDQRSGDDAGHLDGDAVGERADRPVRRRDTEVRGARRRLHGDHAHRGPHRLHRDRHAGGEATAAERYDHAREVGHVVDQLEPERALPRHHHRIVERMAEREPGRVGVGACRGHRLVHARAALVHDGAERAARLDLRDRRAGGHEQLAGHAVEQRGHRERLRVVAGAAGGHAAAGRVAERGERVHRAADLERAGSLQVLGLQHDVGVRPLRQGGRGDHRGVLHQPAPAVLGGADGCEVDGRHAADGTRAGRRRGPNTNIASSTAPPTAPPSNDHELPHCDSTAADASGPSVWPSRAQPVQVAMTAARCSSGASCSADSCSVGIIAPSPNP